MCAHARICVCSWLGMKSVLIAVGCVPRASSVNPQPLLASGDAAHAAKFTHSAAAAAASSAWDVQRTSRLAWQLTAAAVIVSAGGPLLALALLGDQFMQMNAEAGESGVLDGRAVAGFILFLAAAACAAPLLLGLALVYIAQHAHSNRGASGRRMQATLAAALLSCLCVSGVVASWVKLLQPELTWTSPNTQNALNQLLGGIVVCVYSLMAVTAGIVAVRCSGSTFCTRRTRSSAADLSDVQGDDWKRNWHVVAAGFLLLCVVCGLTTILSSIWNFQASSYFPWISPFAINGQSSILTWGCKAGTDGCDAPPTIVFKLYKDVAVYFGFLAGVMLLGFAASAHPRLRRLLHTRVSVCRRLPSWLSPWPQGATIGELLLTAGVCALFGWWFHFWAIEYPRFRLEAEAGGERFVDTHVYARVLGHMTTLSMSFCVLPVTRNSVWESAFGVPFERAVKYHRAMGRVVWMFVTTHMLLWQGKWLAEGTLWHNVFTMSKLIISNSDPALYPSAIHWDNFTIIVAEVAWLLLTVVLVAAQFARRMNYELFHYLHHAVWFFLIAAIAHAWSHWYYSAGAIALYAFDKVTRLLNSTRRAKIVSLSHSMDAGVTRMEVEFCGVTSEHKAGQYAFICLPALAPFQWHPFTISSPPHLHSNDDAASSCSNQTRGNTVTFFIKDMGLNTWSGELAALASSLQQTCDSEEGGSGAGDYASLSLSDLAISIDGPYGRAGHYYECETLVLVAGGIGITPMVAIATDLARRRRALAASDASATASSSSLLQQQRSASSCIRTCSVHLVWSMRERALVASFADQLASLKASCDGLTFHFHLHHTAGTTETATAAAAVRRARNKELHTVDEPSEVEYHAVIEDGTGGVAATVRPLPSSPTRLGWSSASNASWATSLLQSGRSDLASIVERAVGTSTSSSSSGSGLASIGAQSSVCVMVCGPEAMVQQASDLALQHRTNFHAETFHS